MTRFLEFFNQGGFILVFIAFWVCAYALTIHFNETKHWELTDRLMGSVAGIAILVSITGYGLILRKKK